MGDLACHYDLHPHLRPAANKISPCQLAPIGHMKDQPLGKVGSSDSPVYTTQGCAMGLSQESEVLRTAPRCLQILVFGVNKWCVSINIRYCAGITPTAGREVTQTCTQLLQFGWEDFGMAQTQNPQ